MRRPLIDLRKLLRLADKYFLDVDLTMVPHQISKILRAVEPENLGEVERVLSERGRGNPFFILQHGSSVGAFVPMWVPNFDNDYFYFCCRRCGTRVIPIRAVILRGRRDAGRVVFNLYCPRCGNYDAMKVRVVAIYDYHRERYIYGSRENERELLKLWKELLRDVDGGDRDEGRDA